MANADLDRQAIGEYAMNLLREVEARLANAMGVAELAGSNADAADGGAHIRYAAMAGSLIGTCVAARSDLRLAIAFLNPEAPSIPRTTTQESAS